MMLIHEQKWEGRDGKEVKYTKVYFIKKKHTHTHTHTEDINREGPPAY